MSAPKTCRPETDIDLYSDAALANPWPHYRALRDLAPAVWLRPTQAYAIARFHDVRAALANWEVFSSASGVALNKASNAPMIGTTLASDPPLHNALRRVLVRPLAPSDIRALTPRLEAEADQIVARLVAARDIDAVADLAQQLPVSIISHLVGLPEDGRERMLEWGVASNDTIGPPNERSARASGPLGEFIEYITKVRLDTLKPGSWAALAAEAAARGEITPRQMYGLVIDYVAPSLHTTMSGISGAVSLFANNPDQWDLLRADPGLLPGAINEVLRLQSPILAFSRLLTRDFKMGDTMLEAGSRAIILYASANRDERRWNDPERFDIRRKAADHLAFGHGEHKCAGLPLALLEMRAIIGALARRVQRIEIRREQLRINNALWGHERLDVTLH